MEKRERKEWLLLQVGSAKWRQKFVGSWLCFKMLIWHLSCSETTLQVQEELRVSQVSTVPRKRALLGCVIQPWSWGRFTQPRAVLCINNYTLITNSWTNISNSHHLDANNFLIPCSHPIRPLSSSTSWPPSWTFTTTSTATDLGSELRGDQATHSALACTLICLWPTNEGGGNPLALPWLW